MTCENADSIPEIIATITEGDRTAVYLAADSDGEPVIYKRIKGDDKSGLYDRIARCDSAFFPRIIRCWYTDGETRVIEEFIEGKELDKILEEGIPFKNAKSMMEQLMEAVRLMHSMDPPLLHRDIKPENILIQPDGRLKLIDFEAVREYTDTEKEKDTILLGTRGYAAPEQFGYNQTDERSDVYSVGIVCNQILNASQGSESRKKNYRKLFSRATMFDPDERFDSVDRMLKSFLREKSGRATAQRTVIAACTVILIVLAVIAGYKYAKNRVDTTFRSSAISFRTVEKVTVMRYSPNGKLLMDRFDLIPGSDYSVSDGIMTITNQGKDKLIPGNYSFLVTLKDGNSCYFNRTIKE